MRTCRSCSPRRGTCLNTCRTDCYKSCCIPPRRCHSFSPKRPFYAQFIDNSGDPSRSLGKCDLYKPYDSPCIPRSRSYIPRVCSPCQTRNCPFSERTLPLRRSCLSRQCESKFRYNYRPCDPTYPCSRDSCLPRTCGPCVSIKEPCSTRKCDPCDLCHSPRCRPSCRRKWESCVSCSPCYPLKCGPCSVSRRWTTPKSCFPRLSCDPFNPCRSSLCEFCSSLSPRACRPRCTLPCDDSPDSLSRMKLRDLTCDKFRKVCYPKELPIKSCTIEDSKCNVCNCSRLTTNEAACEVSQVDPNTHAREDEGPSENFIQKSKRLGNCMGRYDAHHCPWEADVSISGTVRGHCTSTAVDVARRMSGRFRAEGDRYTTDSCENKMSYLPDTQRMSLGRLDDGTILNFSRNNYPTEKEMTDNLRDSNKSNVTLTSSADTNKATNQNRRKQGSDNQHGDCDNYSSSECTVSSEKPSGVSSGKHWSHDNIHKDHDPHCSRRPVHHSVKFCSDIKTTDYQNALGVRDQNESTSCTDVKSFLNSRKDHRRRNRASSPVHSRMIMKTSSPIQRPCYGRRLSISPNSRSIRHFKAPYNSDSDSPLFTPPTHRCSLGDRHNYTSKSREDLAFLKLHSLREDDIYRRKGHVEYREISLENDNSAVYRGTNFQFDHGVDKVLADARHREHY